MAKKPPVVAGAVSLNPLSDQPWWVRSLVWVGVPTATAGYLLYFVVALLSTRLDSMSTAMEKHQQDMATLVMHLQQETEQSWVAQSTLSRICINTARTDMDRLACVTVPRQTQ